MHKSFYKLDCEPFDLQPDPMFLWMGEKYKEALSVLRYGILDNKGFLLLIGESGVGKTTLLRTLTESLPPDVLWAIIPNPDAPKMEMFNTIGHGFGLDKEYNSKVEFMLDFGTFLQERHDENKKVLLIVDSAHLLNQENLEELRLLSNIEQADTKLIHIFFAAQPSFSAILTRPRNSAIRQRLSLTHTIEPLTAQETAEYIEHRFSVAGVENRILTEKAIRSVHHFSGGIPKKINVICQQVLIEGAKQGRRVIDQGAVQECMQKFASSDDANRMNFAAAPMRGRAGEDKPAKSRVLLVGFGALALAVIIIGAGYFLWLRHGQANRPASAPVAAVKSQSVAGEAVGQPEPPKAGTAAPDTPANIMIDRIAARPVASSADTAPPPVDKVDKTPPIDKTPPVNKTPQPIGAAANVGAESTAATVTISPVTGLATVRPTASGGATETKSSAGAQEAAVKDAPVPVPHTPTAPKASPPASTPQATPTTNDSQAADSDVEEIIIDPNQKGDMVPVAANTVAAQPQDSHRVASQTVSKTAPQVSPPSVATTPPPAKDNASAKEVPQLKAILPLNANSRTLTREGEAALANFVSKFKETGRGRIEVRGYVSSDTRSEGNTQLSTRRAEAVQAMLIHAGVDQASIVVRGMGIQDPLASNDTPEGRNKNRRVELEIIP